MDTHEHNGIDSPKLSGRALKNAPFDAITDISTIAGATYGVPEQAMLNDMNDTLNSILTILRKTEIIRQ